MKNKKIFSFILIFLFNLFFYQIALGANIENPLAITEGSAQQIVSRLIETVLLVIGSLAFLVFFVGGVMWITSGGNEDKIKKGSQAMMWAAIGIVVIFSSYAIINLILISLLKTN